MSKNYAWKKTPIFSEDGESQIRHCPIFDRGGSPGVLAGWASGRRLDSGGHHRDPGTGLPGVRGTRRRSSQRPPMCPHIRMARPDHERWPQYFAFSQLRKCEKVGGRGVRHVGARSPRPQSSQLSLSVSLRTRGV